MIKKARILVVCLVGLVAPGCGVFDNLRQDKRDHEAIQAALDKYLATHLDLSTVNVENEEFNTDRDHAEIIIEITAKQGGAESKRKYTLDREAGVWMVKTDKLFSGGTSENPAAQKP